MKKAFLLITVALVVIITVKALPAIFFNIGKSALDKKDYKTAYTNLEKAKIFSPGNKDYRYYYVQALINLSPDVSIQKKVFEMSQGNDSAAALAQAKVNVWRQNVLQNVGDNYIELVPQNGRIIRWAQSSFPLKVRIANESNVSVPEYYDAEIKRAFNQWQTSINILKFVFTNDNADILIDIKPLPDNVCQGNTCMYQVGITEPKISGSNLNKMVITIYSADPRGEFFSDKELYNTVLHEIGHALGIMGHSYNSDDLMYMSASENHKIYDAHRSSFQYLTTQDINTIKLLYKLVPDVTNADIGDTKVLIYPPIILGSAEEISNRKIKEALHYIEKAPDMAGGYIDLAAAYEEQKEHQKALEAMGKALPLAKTDDERYLVFYNSAIICINKKSLNQAFEYAKKAQAIKDTPEVREIIQYASR